MGRVRLGMEMKVYDSYDSFWYFYCAILCYNEQSELRKQLKTYVGSHIEQS